jgi:hypothetical protein
VSEENKTLLSRVHEGEFLPGITLLKTYGGELSPEVEAATYSLKQAIERDVENRAEAFIEEVEKQYGLDLSGDTPESVELTQALNALAVELCDAENREPQTNPTQADYGRNRCIAWFAASLKVIEILLPYINLMKNKAKGE